MAAKREPITVVVDGNTYLVGGIPPRKAFHVFRKCLPGLGAIAPVIRRLFGDENFEEFAKAAAKAGGVAELGGASGAPAAPDLDPKEMVDLGIQAGEGVVKALSDMSEEDADFVLDNLLTGVQVQIPTGSFMPVIERGKTLELGWEIQLALASHSARYNYADFFRVLASLFGVDRPEASPSNG